MSRGGRDAKDADDSSESTRGSESSGGSSGVDAPTGRNAAPRANDSNTRGSHRATPANSAGKSNRSGESAKSDANSGADRPGASGHRFGPDLACSECGILWDAHQRQPAPCKTEEVGDAFGRRPSGDFDAPPASAAAPPTPSGTNDPNTKD